MGVPAGNVTEVPPEVAPAPSSSTKTCVFFGCSSKGPLLTPTPFSRFQDCAAMFGTGTAVKASAYSNAKTAADFVFIRLPAIAGVPYTSPVDITGITGNLNPTVSGTPNDNYEVVIEFQDSGTTGVSGMHYKISLDGGVTFGNAIALGTNLSITVTGTGTTVSFSTGKTVNAGDALAYHTFAGSSAILPVTITRANSGSPSTSAITASGTPNDAYDIIFRIIAGGTVGTAGITYQYSLDAENFTSVAALGTNNSVALMDGVEPSGVTVNLGSGTLDALDKAAFKTTGPAWQSSDVTAALAALRTSNLLWSFLHGVGDTDSALAGSVGGILAGWAAKTKFAWAALSTRDRGTNESEATWIARLIADFASYADTRIAEGAGYATITCPITGRRNRRPAMWTVVPRLIQQPAQVDPAKKTLGPLSSDVTLHDANNQLVEHDANANSALHDARFVTLRSFDDEPGVFVTRGNLMGPPTDIQRIAYRVVLNLAEEVYQKAMAIQLESEFGLWPAGTKAPYKAGDVYEPHARRIEREIRVALQRNIVEQGMASAVVVTLNRTPVSLGSGHYKLLCNFKLTGLGYIDLFEGTAGYTDPALDALINQG